MEPVLMVGFLGMPGGSEWFVILVIALLVFGDRLPDVMRTLGSYVKEFKDGLSGMPKPPQDPFRSGSHDNEDPYGRASRDSVSRDSVSRDSVSRDSVSRDSVSRDSVSRDSVSRDSVSRDSVSRDSVSPVPTAPEESPSAGDSSDDERPRPAP